MLSTLIALPYKAARLPLTVVDRSLARRWSETSSPRVGLDRVLGSSDRFAGTLLGNRELAKSGTDRLERSEKLLTAERLEQEAETRRAQAAKTAATGRRTATKKRREAQDRAEAGLAEADAAEKKAKQEAKAAAAKTAAAKKKAAGKRAAGGAGAGPHPRRDRPLG